MAWWVNFVSVNPGQWIQIAEQRKGRRALLVQLLGGAAILSPQPNAPFVSNQFGNQPCGLFHSLDNGNGPSVFRLSRELDGEVVEAAWYAWVLPGTVPTPVPGFLTFITSDIWTVPNGVMQATFRVIGGGGGGGQSDGLTFSAGGGGGSAYAESTLPTVPGTVWTIFIGNGGTLFSSSAFPSWASNTGAQPTMISEGVLADPGQNANVSPGGIAGSAAASIGNLTFDGANGGDGQPTTFPFPGSGGGGGGGAASQVGPGVIGTNGSIVGTGGAGGSVGGGIGEDYGAGTQGGSGAINSGGGGGGNAGSYVFLSNSGADGVCTIQWNAPPNSPSILTVVESYEVAGDNNQGGANAVEDVGTFEYVYPKLSPDGLRALRELMGRAQQ